MSMVLIESWAILGVELGGKKKVKEIAD